MKNIFKKTFIVLLSAIIIFAGTAPVSNAASKHMIIVNTKKNTLDVLQEKLVHQLHNVKQLL